MFGLTACAIFLTFAAHVAPQFFNAQMQQILNNLNNITVNDISNILRQLPVPHPLAFDGLPLSRNDVNYYLFTRRNSRNPVFLKGSSTKFGTVDPRNPVKFIIHGWLESANSTYYDGIIEAYLRRGEYNVMGVDWSSPAMSEYSFSARNTKTAGRELGDFIIRLSKATGIPLSQMHILGHSLGAHLAGFAGKHVINRTGRKIGRISGLDAAGPLYEYPIPVDARNRLDKNDADFVDCIHTDGGIFGMVEPIGHIDFYPNGGVPRQPGCSLINIRELSSRVIIDDSVWASLGKYTNFFKNLFCSHYRSHELYKETINSNKFKALECDSYENFRAGRCAGNKVVQMGEDTDPTSRGKYYLDTIGTAPFIR